MPQNKVSLRPNAPPGDSLSERRPPPFFVPAILATGMSGIVAQVLLLRELLIGFNGNELTIGIILANWVAAEALGVWFFGRRVEKIPDKTGAFVCLQLIFCALLPCMIYFARVFKNAAGIPPGAGAGLLAIFCVSFCVMLPVSFCHGALFSAACRIFYSIGKSYKWETAGTIIGGFTLTYIFLPLLNSFQIAFLIVATNLLTGFFLLKESEGGIKYVFYIFSALFLVLCLTGGAGKLNSLSIKRQWQPAEVIDYENSLYGNIAVVKKAGQTTFFYNGVPLITAPYPDIIFTEEFGNLPLLFHPAPRSLLIIGAGAGGLINEALKYPLNKIDYTELDPLLIRMLHKYPAGVIKQELDSPRVNTIKTDGRFFVSSTGNKYDVVMLGLSKPVDLTVNRYFTREFFALVKKRLLPDGIFAFWLPGSTVYLGQELKGLNACILKALQDVFADVRVIPGDYNIFLASGPGRIQNIGSAELKERLRARNSSASVIVPAYLDYKLDPEWIKRFNAQTSRFTGIMNRDTAPFAVFEMLAIWNKQFSPGFQFFFTCFRQVNFRAAALCILFLTLLLLLISRGRPNASDFKITYAIFTTGLFGMFSNLILIFSFQVSCGYLYRQIGVLISLFMAGNCAGSILLEKHRPERKKQERLFRQIETAVILFSIFLAIALGGNTNNHSLIYFCALFFISGVLVGAQFILAGRIYGTAKSGIGEAAGTLYSADLLGGWIAGLIAGTFLLPVLGVFYSCMTIAVLKLGSLAIDNSG